MPQPRHLFVCTKLGALLWVLSLPVAAQPSGDAVPLETMRTLQRLARAVAHAELVQQVRRLPISANATVGDCMARDVDLDRALRLWIRQHIQPGRTRLYSDAVCEADVQLDPDGLLRQLTNIISEQGHSTAELGVSTASLRQAAQRWPVLWATGAASPDLQWRADHPPGWENVTRQGVEAARRAALGDALATLRRDINRLFLGRDRRVADFLAFNARVEEFVDNRLRRAIDSTVNCEPDRTAVARATISVRELMRILSDAHERHARGSDFALADFRRMVLDAPDDTLSGTGLATPAPDALLQTKYTPVEYNAPSWAGRTLRATGQYDPDDEENLPADVRIELARLDGVNAVRAQVMDLVIQRDVTIAEFLGYYQNLKPDVALLLSATRPAGTPTLSKEGTVSLPVALPLRRLWEIVRREMKLQAVEPPRGALLDTEESP